jgi:hypothetical protein
MKELEEMGGTLCAGDLHRIVNIDALRDNYGVEEEVGTLGYLAEYVDALLNEPEYLSKPTFTPLPPDEKELEQLRKARRRVKDKRAKQVQGV